MNKKYILGVVLCLFSLGRAFADEALSLASSPQEIAVPLTVEGKLPSWLSGALVRNSAIPILKDGKQVSHAFDGIAMLHKCTFHQGKVHYQSRYLDSKEYRDVVVDGKIDILGFATAPSQQKKLSLDQNEINNASVNIFTYDDSFVALTETPLPVRFDLNTLETLGSFDFQDGLPKHDCWESAHPHYDADKKEIINYLIEFGKSCNYVVYRMKEGSKAREVIARIPVESPSYMHSFAMTANYVILTEFPLLLNTKELLDPNKGYIQKFQWLAERGTRFTVIERTSGRIVLQKAVDPIFSFHHANAYEKDGTIIVDLVAYPDLSSMPTIFPQASQEPAKWKNRLIRYEISLKEEKIKTSVLLETKELEYPRFANHLDGKTYRYLYMYYSDQNITQGLVKFDLESKECKTWSAKNFEVGEPIFVSSPTAKSEDDGVVLTIMTDKTQNQAFLVVLEAKTFTELARAKLPNTVPASFHGQYYDK